jgi:hypothetical protein
VPTRDSGDTGGGGGGGGGTGALVTTIDLSEGSVKKTVAVGNSVGFSMISSAGGEAAVTHTVKVIQIIGSQVTLYITSTPMTIIMNAGETRYIDLDDDDANDITIKITRVSSGAVDMVVTTLVSETGTLLDEAKDIISGYIPSADDTTPSDEVATPVDREPILPPAEEASPVTMIILVIVVVAVVIGAGYWISQHPEVLKPKQ